MASIELKDKNKVEYKVVSEEKIVKKVIEVDLWIGKKLYNIVVTDKQTEAEAVKFAIGIDFPELIEDELEEKLPKE